MAFFAPLFQVKVFKSGSGQFCHGYTFQSHPLGCAIGSKVLDILCTMIDRISNMGEALQEQLKKRVGWHAHIGDIRGRGLFVGVCSLTICLTYAMLM